jgi:hypothetical protein
MRNCSPPLPGCQGIAMAVKNHQRTTYIFAVRMEDSPAKATFSMAGMSGTASVEVIGETRTIRMRDGRFEDNFGPHAVHLYRVAK